MLFQLLVIFFVLVQISEQTCRTDDCYSCSLHKDCCITCKCYKSQKFQRTIDTFGCDYKKCDKYDDGKCYSCVDGYYLQNSICYLCTYPCIECQSSKKCKKCSQGYKLSNDKCIQCTVPLCKDCDSNSNQCSQCVNNATYNSSIQECVCNASYFQVSGQCKQCISICGTCSNSYNNCATCKSVSNMSATPINGVCSCVTGYYWNQSNSQCNQCTAPCLTCEDEATQCTSCNGASLTVNDDNQCTCQVGYFSSPNDLYQCEVCSKNCLTCADISNKCTSCYENYELNDGTNSCFCPDGFFEIDNICNKCDSLCSKCSSNSVCTECIDNQFVKFSNQQCTCMDGYYFDAIQSTCLQCDSTCKTCQTQKEMCSSCSLESNRILRVNKCICKPDFFLNVNQLCISCKSKEAIAIEFCKYRDCADGIWSYGEECNDANYSSRDGCYNCLLEPQYYCINEIQKPSQCFKCQEYCSVCEYDYLNKKQVCKQAIDGYYIENSIRINKCGDKCLHCQSNASQCTQCRFLNISKSNINCQLCEYKQGYYTDYENNSCYSKCGDAILADVEQCDDGNRINGDGCSDHCFLEKSFDCLNGVCSKTKNPIPSGQENKIYDLYTPKRVEPKSII
ncbi:unnamed protein product [Paramecium octaurelia]|uniref:EGF-like domain-containing protein n=1 Tax=Paramecium octaurelia TaxID=43137 RepID=A0A8S1S733_PAROT|nr:unnamed protein product [Paramecium octaurelia]